MSPYRIIRGGSTALLAAASILALASHDRIAAEAVAQSGRSTAATAPSYLRSRSGGGAAAPRTHGYNARSVGYGFIAPFYQPPVVSGFWYERPYPYHFDYYRSRWSAAPPTAAADCPCAAPSP